MGTLLLWAGLTGLVALPHIFGSQFEKIFALIMIVGAIWICVEFFVGRTNKPQS